MLFVSHYRIQVLTSAEGARYLLEIKTCFHNRTRNKKPHSRRLGRVFAFLDAGTKEERTKRFFTKYFFVYFQFSLAFQSFFMESLRFLIPYFVAPIETLLGLQRFWQPCKRDKRRRIADIFLIGVQMPPLFHTVIFEYPNTANVD